MTSPSDFLDRLDYIRDSIPQFLTFADTLRNDASAIQQTCGQGSVPVIATTGDVMSQILCNVAGTLSEVRVFFFCDNWYPLYQKLTYDTACYSGTDGFTWVASTQFVIVFMTMIILTLRITFYEVEAGKETTDVKDPNVKDAEKSEPSETVYENPIQLSPETPNDTLEGTWDEIIPEQEAESYPAVTF
jgi:hypothetical protein